MGGQMFWRGPVAGKPAATPSASPPRITQPGGASSWSLIPPSAYNIFQQRGYMGSHGLNDGLEVGAGSNNAYVDSDKIPEGRYWFVLAAAAQVEANVTTYPVAVWLVPESDRSVPVAGSLALGGGPIAKYGIPLYWTFMRMVYEPTSYYRELQHSLDAPFVIPAGYFLRVSAMQDAAGIDPTTVCRLAITFAEMDLPCDCG